MTLDLRDANHIEDMLWYDGPVVSLWEMDGKLYFGLFTDIVGLQEIWVVGETTAEKIAQYRAREVTTRDILETSPALYKGENNYWFMDAPPLQPTTWDDIPEDCRPTPDSFL